MVVAVALDGISRQSRAGGIIGLLAVMAVELNGVWHVYNKTCTSCHETNQIGALADYVNNRVQPGDGILVLEFFIHLSMVYYVTTDPPPMQYTPKGPDGSSGRPNGYQISTLIQDKADQIYVDNLDSLTTASGRLWLIDAYDRGTLARKLPAHWRLLGTYTFGKEKPSLWVFLPWPVAASNRTLNDAVLAADALKTVHQQHPARLGLVRVDLWHQPGEVFALAVNIQSSLVGPLFDKDKVPRVFLVDKQIVGDAQRFLAGFFHQFGIPGPHRVQVFGFDKVFSDYFQHQSGPSSNCFFMGLETVGPCHLPHARIELAVHLAGQQFPWLEEHMQL